MGKVKSELEHRENVHIRRYKVKKGHKQTLLLASDLHADNPKADLNKIRKDFDEAVKRDARIIINGDTMCLMQGKYDKRSSKSDVRPEHKVSNYLDAVVDWTIDLLLPYAHHIDFIGQGNHETAIKKRHETDLMKRLVDGLNDKSGANIGLGGYGGFYVSQFDLGSKHIFSHKLHYFHGSGGGGPVTKGAIQFNRKAAAVQGVDAIWMSHVHESMEVIYSFSMLNNYFEPVLKNVLMIRTPTYKEEYKTGKSGWHVERGAPPKPIGGRWMELQVLPNSRGIKQWTYAT